MFNLIDLNDFDLNEVFSVLELASEIKVDDVNFKNAMSGKILGLLFFEPSTRTRNSFQTAMFKMGGQCLNLGDVSSSSVAKGESFSDTVKIMSLYSNLIVVRHFCDGAARAASLVAKCPVINAGDGIHLHPTQTLTDLLTIKELKNGFDGLNFGFCGDLKFSRPVNSLVRILCNFENNSFVFISSKEQQVSSFLRNFIKDLKVSCKLSSSLEEEISNLDVLYMTRVQRERFKTPDEYEKQKGRFKLTKMVLNSAKPDLIVLHPLPRVDEIDSQVDADSRAVYFIQALNGVFVRMALILKLQMNLKNKAEKLHASFFDNAKVLSENCCNENCISRFDLTLPKLFKNCSDKLNVCKCAYCDCVLG